MDIFSTLSYLLGAYQCVSKDPAQVSPGIHCIGVSPLADALLPLGT